MLPPLPRCSGWAYSSLISPSRVSLPRKGRRVGLHIDIFEACSAFTRVAACTLALSPIRDTLIEGFSHFVTSMTAPIASGWSESPGGACTHWKAPPCHGAPPFPPLPLGLWNGEVAWRAAVVDCRGLGCASPESGRLTAEVTPLLMSISRGVLPRSVPRPSSYCRCPVEIGCSSSTALSCYQLRLAYRSH